jgi:hypothetical protein
MEEEIKKCKRYNNFIFKVIAYLIIEQDAIKIIKKVKTQLLHASSTLENLFFMI